MIQDNLQLFSFKFSNLPGCRGSEPCVKQGAEPADFWQIGRILLKNDVISMSFNKINASKFNKKAILPIIYADFTFATPTNKRKPQHESKTPCLTHPGGKN
ncbi:hypothetical protein [Aeromonas molluscorum]|uniref:hypothetical protein n=1 Tax=Aeromonas molluscorum TaxID=271417 RepID=UPI003F1A9EF1